MAGRCPPSLQEIPSDPCLATRKLARNFVIVEGAYALMSRRSFVSFKQGVVLQGLRRTTRRWGPLLRVTEAVLSDPFRANVKPGDFMRQAQPFVAWAIKTVLLRVGGVTLYRRAAPVFLGLTIGCFTGIALSQVVDAMWFPGLGHFIYNG